MTYPVDVLIPPGYDNFVAELRLADQVALRLSRAAASDEWLIEVLQSPNDRLLFKGSLAELEGGLALAKRRLIDLEQNAARRANEP